MVNLLGFAGPAGSGKDTCAQFFVQRGWKKDSFAAPMYKGLEAMGFGWPETQAEKEAIIEGIGVSWRHAAQTLGTEWGRNLIHPDLWTELARNRIKEETYLHVPSTRFVFADVRFENEAAMIREMGGIVVHILGRRLGTGNDNHISEQTLLWDKTDFPLWNQDGVEELEYRLGLLLKHCDSL